MMNNSLTIIEEMITIPSVGETEASSAEEQLARDSQLGVTDYRMGGRFQTGHPAHFLAMVILNSLMPKKTSLPKASTLLTVKGICPIHAEPVHYQKLLHIVCKNSVRSMHLIRDFENAETVIQETNCYDY